MKTSFVAVALSFAAIGSAAPTAESRKWPYSIDSLSLKHLIESNTFDLSWTLTSRGPYGEDLGSTTCHTAWYNGSNPVGPENPESCADPAYQYWFPNGLENLESYEIAVKGSAGPASTTISAGPKYQCGPYTGPIGNVDKECKITNGGAFYLHE
ncbi:unnamed protein product [Penicillium salamii]|uniref:AA1-like domain-containing protein n=1 Tax=Penicillium salamii TaxID=1612424 RepID=A0A9W4N4W0_9EURO|nr:unnamed protein product [Penicillium salamii]CAG7964733.1 unnamed protein product [Penicillium salamii]CAG7985939.1 unnamed protein product [Penicillium salamii]CAG8134903.1 unnamed protein product [Penicillium salamii]CAG8190907.1 unnamed protein product [Penicillium salamii]